MRHYEQFSRIYDRYWGERSISFLPLIRKLLLSHVPPGSRIVDLCCGTGQVAAVLEGDGYSVTGVDASNSMLRIARKRAPKAKFIHCDVRSFRQANSFNAAICLYDSLNHIMSIDDLMTVFRNVRHSLVRGGRFGFDLNTENKYLNAWDGTFQLEDGEGTFTVVATHETNARVAKFHGEWKSREGELTGPVDLEQTWYGLEEIRTALRESGFGIHREVEADGEEGKHLEDAEKVFFFARRIE